MRLLPCIVLAVACCCAATDPLRFEPVRGTGFVAHGLKYNLSLDARGARLTLAHDTIMMRLPGAGLPGITGEQRLAGYSNYYIGSDPARWRTGVPNYGQVRYQQVYRGVDLVFYGKQGELEYDFLLAPGVHPSTARIAFDGVAGLRLDRYGDLLLKTHGEDLRFRRPVIYQRRGGQKQMLAGRYVLRGNVVSFAVDAYDSALPIVIDPVLSYSTYLGGWGDDSVSAIAVDDTGAAYVAGWTRSDDFPVTVGAFQDKFAGEGGYAYGDVFVGKLDASGSALIWATYLGGSSGEGASSIVLDRSGNVYVTGYTQSSNFPTTPGALRTARGSVVHDEGFVAKFSAKGQLMYSTFLGDDAGDSTSFAIAVDASGNAYVAGTTNSPTFPLTAGVFQRKYAGGRDRTMGCCGDAFVAKLNPAGSALVYSTYLGGSADDEVLGLAIDAAGYAYVSGTTLSSDFPTVKPAQASYGGSGYSCGDAFVAKLDPTAAALVYSTYLGGARCDSANGLAVDSTGAAYVAGHTDSANFPTTAGAYQTTGKTQSCSYDAFAAKLSSTGALVYSTYLAGTGDDEAHAIAVDGSGRAWIAGETRAGDFPVVGGVQSDYGYNSNAFVLQLNAQGSALLHSSLLGYGGEDRAVAITLGSAGSVYVAGNTDSAFPALFSSQERGNGEDGFVAKIANEATVSTASYTRKPLVAQSWQSYFGASVANSVVTADSSAMPTTLGGVTVKITDSAGVDRLAQLSMVSPGQVNYLVPDGVATGPAIVTLTASDGQVHRDNLPAGNVAPGLFTANASGQGVAAAYLMQIGADGSRTMLPVSRYDAAQGKSVSIPLDLGTGTDQFVLLLFGTGIRGAADVKVTIGGDSADVLYAGAQGQYAGLDQVNVLVPRSVVGFGETPVVLTANDQPANTVTINIAGIARPRITLLSNWGAEAGETLANFSLTGQFFAGATALTVTPPEGVAVSGFSVAGDKANAQLVVASDAGIGPRQISIITPGGASIPARFNIRAKGASPAPAIFNVKLGQVPSGHYVIVSGSFDFTDADGDLVYTGAYAAPTVQLGPSSCSITLRGPFFNQPGQTSGTIEFAAKGTAGSLTLGSQTANFVVTDAGGHRSNVVQIPVTAWICPQM